MSKNLYISAIEPKSGKSVIALGIMEMLVRNIHSVCFFRPIIDTNGRKGEKDPEIELIADYYGLIAEYDEMFAFELDEATALVAKGDHEKLLDGILQKYNKLEAHYDFVLCLGTDYEGVSSAFEFDINAEIAKNLGCPVLIVTNAHEKNLDQILENCNFALQSFEEKNCDILGLIINRCPKGFDAKSIQKLQKDLSVKVEQVYAIEEEPKLSRHTVEEVASLLDAEVLFGFDKLGLHVSGYVIAAMQLRHFLRRIEKGSLVLVPGDRLDIIMGCLASYHSAGVPNLAGILLTEDILIDENLFRLIEGIEDLIPFMKVEMDTFKAASLLDSLHSKIGPKDLKKISLALGLFESTVDISRLKDAIVHYCYLNVTPKMFEYGLIKRAKSKKQRIVLPEGEDERILRAVDILNQRDMAEFTLLGDPQKIEKKIQALGLEKNGLKLVSPIQSEHFDQYVQAYFQLRKHKGITLENARDMVGDVSYFGTMMVQMGDADGMVSGAVHSTMQTIRPALEIIKTKQGCLLASSVFFMCLEDRVLVYGDCAINPNPTAEQLADIAIASAETASKFGIEPRVAMLSYSTGGSGKGEDVDKVRHATEIAQGLRPDLLIEGPIQYDAAVEWEVAKIKLPGSQVAGRATVFIFPDLNTGNNTYKAVQRSAGAVAIGPVMQGLNKPVNDLSRGCLVADVINTIAITAIQAQQG